MEQNNFENDFQKPSRTSTLTTLCVLTFIWSGLSAFSYLMMGMSWDTVIQMVDSGDVPMAEQMSVMVESMSKNYMYMSSFLNFISLVGAILIWNLNKLGFHFYAGAQLFLLLLPIVFFKGMGFPWFDMIISIGFVFLYWKAIQVSTKVD